MIKTRSVLFRGVVLGFLFFGIMKGFLYPSQTESLSHILKQLKTYQQGENDSLVLELNAFISSHRATKEERLKCERELIIFLRSDASISSKMEVCRHLRIIGGRESVPVLEDMLLHKETTDMARYALEKIPGIHSETALLRGLKNSNGIIQTGIVSSLGHRKVTQAVPYLKKILYKNTDLTLSYAAAAALGHIKTPMAAKALSEMLPKTSGVLKTQVAGSLLKCAEEYSSKNKNDQALKLYNQILSSDLPLSLHHSAVRGKINTTVQMGDEFILKNIKQDPENITLYIEMIPEYVDASQISLVLEQLPPLSPSAKVALISVLSLYPEDKVLHMVLDSTQSPSQEVRVASLHTLKQIGSSSIVPFLAEYAASTQELEQEQARQSLWELKGTDVDSTIVSHLKTEEDPEIQIEYIKAVEERRIYSGKERLLDLVLSSDPKIRVQALRSLKHLTSPQDIPLLLEFLTETQKSPDREELMNTIASAASKIPHPLDRGEAVTRALPEVKNPASRASLYLLLGRIGDDSTLSQLRKGMNEPQEVIQNAVVRALAMWPSPSAADDVLYIAQSSDKQEHQILCLRSFIRMVEMESFRRPEAAVRDLETALDLAQRPEEKTMILGVLPKFACVRAIHLAQKLTGDPDVKTEARNALQIIKGKLQK
ncbi:MAG: hypothetical protein GF421_03860 [Candidatus Aminicenantes bacterium]|nr:hypothetical protein [Candidatus Aminicenantes bacterium]